MRLKEPQVEKICNNVVDVLLEQKYITLKAEKNRVLAKMKEAFLKDLRVEDELNKEVEKILEESLKKAGGNIDRQKMFILIKKQLIRDRNLVI